MAKKASRRPVVKTLSIVKSRDIVVDKLLKPCEDGDHSKCTGWAVLKKEISPINANYFLKCSCSCHHHHHHQHHKKEQLKSVVNQLPKTEKKTNEKKKKSSSTRRRQKPKNQKKTKTNKRAKRTKKTQSR